MPARPGGHFMPARRLDAMVDAVLAITMTLLVLELRLPDLATPDLLGAVLELQPKFASWVLSFLLLALLWSGHVRAFRHVEDVDSGLFWLVIFWLLATSLLPFSSSLLGEFPGRPESYVVYAANLIVVEALIVLRNLSLLRRGLFAGGRRLLWLSPLFISLCAVASALVGLRWPQHGSTVYLLIIPTLIWTSRQARRAQADGGER